MKFKYNPLAKKLWRIEEDYFYEISEQNRILEFRSIGSGVVFKLGAGHWLLLNFDQMIVHYTKTGQNGEAIHYEKQIKRKFSEMETIFEFSEADRVENTTLKNYETK